MIRNILFLYLAFALMGCGTVVRGTKQGVRFESEPPGAAVTVARAKKRDTQWHCTSPCELQLSRKRDFDVTFELEGYKPAQGRLASRLGAKGGATAVAGNFVAGGGVGFIVDAGTGANMQLKPDPMRARLAAVASAENSVIYDVRIEGGGVEDVYETEGDATDLSAANTGAAPSLKRLSLNLGVDGSPITETSAIASVMSDPHGVLITKIEPDGAAARAGVNVGDIIQSINSTRVSTMDDLNAVVAQMDSGETATLTIWRDRARYEATLVY